MEKRGSTMFSHRYCAFGYWWLRDLRGKVLCLFSFYMGVLDSNVAELWDIRRAVVFCQSNLSLQGRNISVVSDSKVAVSWVNNSDFGNITQTNSIMDIRNIINSIGGMAIFDHGIFISFADCLAKMVASTSGDLIEWEEF
ncbi:hypothetical protein Ddye_018822 [Dipteronia dyeriana]|uniref:RNase H type-1 domain-containing protein n=1 Tax=Dipteronia dyeriana TaxID=168575 RepID=A0AAD9X206_9ROSI|nr:hypothetical protein Ddye_018822 [Dipteronia dyeriana]